MKYEKGYILDVDTNIVYKNTSVCAYYMGTSRGHICDNLKGRRENVKGHHFARYQSEEPFEYKKFDKTGRYKRKK